MLLKLSKKHRETLMKNMCDNLAVFRTKLNLSQGDLADRLGVTRQTVSAFESGQRALTWSVFLALVLIFFTNNETKRLLVALEIYTKELDSFLTFKQI
jgi:DNA-binding XRE family transcriptional regulator